MIVFGATCQQATHWVPQCSAARLIMLVAFIILMFLYTSYSANIVALLQSPSTRIKTLKDLYESRLEIGVDDTVFNRYYFAVSEQAKLRMLIIFSNSNHKNITHFLRWNIH